MRDRLPAWGLAAIFAALPGAGSLAQQPPSYPPPAAAQQGEPELDRKSVV